MKILLITLMIALSGCANMTTGQKTAAWIAAGVVVGLVASSSSDDPSPPQAGQGCVTVSGSDGRGGTTSNQVC